MKVRRAKRFLMVTLLSAAIISPWVGCGSAPIPRGPVAQGKLMDGVYEGTCKAGPNKADVRVTIKDNRIVDIEIVKHRAWKGKKAEPVIPGRIVEEQSTEVDAVSGATNSSRVIMNAVQRAIEKAYEK